MKTKTSLLIVLLIIMLFLPCNVLRADTPPPPAGYYGKVYCDGVLLQSGQVQATVDGQIQGSWTIDSGNYGDPASLRYLKVEGNFNGKTVRFQVVTSDVLPAVESVAWEAGYPKELNLHCFTGAPLAPPAFQGISCSPDNKTVTVKFDRELDAMDGGELKAAVSIKKDGSSDFVSLAPGDTVTISSSSIVIRFASALKGTGNEIKILASAVGFSGQTMTSDLTVTVPIEGCFVATAAFGSYLDPHVWVLRQFRDRLLLANSWGTAFVEFYYRHSPPIAGVIASNTNLKALVRILLLPLIGAAYLLLHPSVLVFLSLAVIFSRLRWVRT